MNFYYTPLFEKKLKKVSKINPKLASSLKQTLKKFTINPKQKSLRLHKLVGKSSTAWSLSAGSNVRIIFQYVKDGIILINFGTHEEVY